MNKQNAREAALLFGENPDLAELNNDRTHRMVYGGCYYNIKTKMIDKVYSKRHDKVYTLTYQNTKWNSIYLVQIVDDYYNTLNLGYLKKNYSDFREIELGGAFFLQGIIESMRIIKREEEARKKADPDGWFD